MKRLDSNRPSLVEFLGSIKFSGGQAHTEESHSDEAYTSHEHFARLRPSTRLKSRAEDAQLIRSAN